MPLSSQQELLIHFIPLQAKHFPLLLQWLEMPHVKKWWDQEVLWTLPLIEEKYSSYIQGYKVEGGLKKPMYAYIICLNQKEIGYIQFYDAYDFTREANLTGLPSSLAALDIFIGDKAYINKGLGSRIIQQFLRDYIEPKFEACFVDPDIKNKQAIKAYEKVGFQKVKTIPEKNEVWMVKNHYLDHNKPGIT